MNDDRFKGLNLTCAFLVSQAVLWDMVERKRGVIVNLAASVGQDSPVCTKNFDQWTNIGRERTSGIARLPKSL